jgi:hypothetical protein
VIGAAFFLVAVLAAVYLLVPTFRRTAVPSADPRTALEAARAAALQSLHDLDLDWHTGKLSRDDYQAARAALEAEAAAVVRRLAALGPPP